LSLKCMMFFMYMPSAACAARIQLTLQGWKAMELTDPPDSDELAEQSEEQVVGKRCMSEFAELGKVGRHGAASPSEHSHARPGEPGPSGTLVQLTAQEVVDGLWHGNTSVLDLLEHGRAAFDDHRCDDIELEDFRGKFGLVGNKCFGKTNFGHGEICESGNVVWIYPSFDNNKAFCINHNVCHRLTLWSSHACSVKVWRVGTVEEAVQVLARYPDDSIKHMVLGGHGDGTSIRWGGKHDGLMGVAGKERPLPTGSIVRATEAVPSLNSVDNWPVGPGHVGYVKRIDSDGDAVIYFDGITTPQQVGAKSFSKLEASPSGGKSFLLALRKKMHKHGTVFADSCLSATSARSPNIAQFVAEQVGKGVRVIGSEVSFGVVRVKRFHAWHGVVEDDRQRTYYAEGAGCPPWAREQRPGGDGNCRCPPGSRCTTAEGGLCPRSDGTTSDEYFLPSCVEGWSQESCRCVPKHIFGKVSLWWTKLFRDTR